MADAAITRVAHEVNRAPPLHFRLYFFFRPGCGWCEKARPITEEVVRAYPGSLMVPVNADRKEDGVRGFSPNGTPGYLLVVGDEVLGGDVGFKTAAQLTKWIEEGLATVGDSEEEPSPADSEEEE